MKAASWTLAAAVFAVAIVGVWAMSADAMTVAGFQNGALGFANFSKAIVFDTSTNPCPLNGDTVQGSAMKHTCALPMRPVGDGSWVCTATVFRGTSYSYWFEYRIPSFDDTGNWKGVGATGTRNQDQTTQRTITVPSTASNGYIFYNYFGDPDVTGKQGSSDTDWVDTMLTAKNLDLATYDGVGVTDVSSSGNNDTTDMGANNNYSVSVVQTADTTVKLTWRLKITGGDDIVPHVEGAKEFDTTSAYNPYGFRILRARLPSGWSADSTTPTHLKFEDTVVRQVTGDTLWSPSRQSLGIGWYDGLMSFTDTSLDSNPQTGGDTYVYTVLWVDAYGNTNDSAAQNFSGGSAEWVRGNRADVLFLVEHFEPGVVFPGGATEGRVRVTPWVSGVPQPAYSFWTPVYMAVRKTS